MSRAATSASVSGSSVGAASMDTLAPRVRVHVLDLRARGIETMGAEEREMMRAAVVTHVAMEIDHRELRRPGTLATEANHLRDLDVGRARLDREPTITDLEAHARVARKRLETRIVLDRVHGLL